MTSTVGGRPVPDTNRPDAWQLVFDQLGRIEKTFADRFTQIDQRFNELMTRAEWAAHKESIDASLRDMHRRIDDVQTRSATSLAELKAESTGAYKELDSDIEDVKTSLAEERKDKQTQASQRRFTIGMAVFTGAVSLFNGVILLVVTGVFGG